MAIEETLISGSGECSVREILDYSQHLGIPHFQRGNVWNSDLIKLFFMSLHEDIPCGSIILWERPESDTGQYGQHISGNHECDKDVKYYIVDGQQRITSLLSIKTPIVDRVQLCVNLQNPYFNIPLIRKSRANELFVFSNYQNEKRAHHNSIPFNRIFNIEDSEIQKIIDVSKTDIDKAKSELVDFNNNILKQTIYIKVLKDIGFAEIIKTYNRINSSGKKVEKEEMAFATLVSIDQNATSNSIRGLFDSIHNRRIGTRIELERLQERNFGFKLFIRTFIQVCNYYFDLNKKTNTDLNFDLISNGKLQDILQVIHQKDSSKINKLWEITKNVLLTTKMVLAEGLFIDDLRFLPEITVLHPLFELLIQYPDLNIAKYGKDEKSIILTHLCLLLLLNPKLNFKNIYSIIRKDSKLIIKINELKKELSFETLLPELIEVRSVQNKYVLLLYGLLRKNVAKDFSYKNLSKEQQDDLELIPNNEKNIDTSVSPEKQHIIPVNELIKTYSLNKNQSDNKLVNNIGNLTYVSKSLNSFRGLSDKRITLAHDSEDNLKKHFITKPLPSEKNQKEYEKFISDRTKLIAEGFNEWHEKLNETAIPDSFNKFCTLEKNPSVLMPNNIVLPEKITPINRDHRFQWNKNSFMDKAAELGDEKYEAIQKIYLYSVRNNIKIKWGNGNSNGSFGGVIKGISSWRSFSVKTNGEFHFYIDILRGHSKKKTLENIISEISITITKRTSIENIIRNNMGNIVLFKIDDWYDKTKVLLNAINEIINLQ